MSEPQYARDAVLDALSQHQELSMTALVGAFQRRGFGSVRDLGMILDILEAEDLIVRDGPPARRVVRLANGASAPSNAPIVLPSPSQTPAPAVEPASRVRRATRTTRHRNLTRMETGPRNRAGYLVRVNWKRQQQGKFFADAEYGDQLAALDAALVWRDATERELGKPRTDQNVVGAVASNTGYLGVTRLAKGGNPAYQAAWIEDGALRRQVFSVAKLGEQGALSAAVKARAEGERRRLGLKSSARKQSRTK